MIAGHTETGSLYHGLAAGELVDRLLAGERVLLPGAPGAAPNVWLSLDRSGAACSETRAITRDGELDVALTGRAIAERLLAGDRVCLSGRPGFPHMCLFYRATNRELLEACRLYFPDGATPDAVLVVASETEPDGRGGPAR